MDENIIKRSMPHNTDAERAVIGSMLLDEQAVTTAIDALVATDFYEKQFQLLFQAMVDIHDKGENVDLLAVQAELEKKKAPAELTDIHYIRELLNSVPTTARIGLYVNLVREKSMLRDLIRVTEDVANECYEGKDDVEDIFQKTEKDIFNVLRSKQKASDYVPIQEVVIHTLEQIEAASRMGGNVTGIPSGFTDLDYKLAGFHPSELILIAARPAMGKTAFELNIASYMAIRKKVSVAIFSLEMSKEQLVSRLLALDSGVSANKIRTGDVDDNDWERLIERANDIGNAQIIIDDTPSISISELRSKCMKYKLENNLGVILIDYLQLMSGGRHAESRQNEISEISRSLKALARELDVPVIALSQLSRAVEKRDDKRPMLSDLRESGAIEQDADVVMFLYRDDYYHPDTKKKGVAEVIIAKQRSGSIGTVELLWLPEYTKFANYEGEKDE